MLCITAYHRHGVERILSHGWQRHVCASCEQLRRAEATQFGGEGQKVSKFSRKPIKGISEAFFKHVNAYINLTPSACSAVPPAPLTVACGFALYDEDTTAHGMHKHIQTRTHTACAVSFSL